MHLIQSPSTVPHTVATHKWIAPLIEQCIILLTQYIAICEEHSFKAHVQIPR